MTVQADRASDLDILKDREFKQLIGGELVAGSSTQDVVDPGTEEIFAAAPVADAAQVAAAVAAAKKAFSTWRNADREERVAAANAIIEAIEDRKEEIARITTLEMGKPYAATLGDVEFAITWSRHMVEQKIEPIVVRDDDEGRVEIRRKPIGVVAAIVPWNFPFFQSVYKVIPAILTGNTVVLKPAPTSPLNGLVLGEIVKDLVPAGVINVIGDGGDVGPALVANPDVAKVSFTGSTAVGRHIMASSGETLRHVVLELGGNDAALVLEDVDVAKAAEGIFTWAFLNTGQVCINIKRIFVPRSRYDEFCDAFAALASAAKIGHGLDAASEFGPMANKKQYEAAKGYLETAKKDGTVIAGGELPDGPGFFVPLTVVKDVDENSSLIREETFGPVRTILPYDDLDDAIERINDTIYGLGNSVWGSDVAEATQIADKLESGSVWVNSHFAISPDVPFGGRKQSGVGTEFGDEGLLLFTDIQVVNVSKL